MNIMQTNDKNINIEIYTINGEALLSNYNVIPDDTHKYRIQYSIDLSSSADRYQFIKAIESNANHIPALFYQLEEVLKKTTPVSPLYQNLIYVDFEHAFQTLSSASNQGKQTCKDDNASFEKADLLPGCQKVTNDFRLKTLFKYGIHITFEDGTTHIFVPYDKSSSMARNSRITFINHEYIQELDKRLLMGIDYSKLDVSLSKFYAYKGLFLSSGKRISHRKLILNADTVVVLKDSALQVADKYMQNLHMISAEKVSPDDSEASIYTKFKLTGLDSENPVNLSNHISQVFDGEGIISPLYSQYLNDQLAEDHGDRLTSYQIRMPFTKGMLHEIDFHGFLREVAHLKENDSYFIEDFFGKKRDLMKAHIILTEGMFKSHKWLKAWIEKYADEVYSIIKSTDPMKYYFHYFHEYKHALYIANTDKPYSNRDLISLNYQFINTLSLDKDSIQQLVDEHIAIATKPVEYLKHFCHDATNDNVTNDNITTVDAISDEGINTPTTAFPVWQQAILINPSLSHDPFIRMQLTAISNSVQQDFALGKLLVSGEIRYLSRDLIYFLIEVLKLPEYITEHYPEDQAEKMIRMYRNQELNTDYFYMPNPQIELKQNYHYPILRSPHLSRNEQCALKPFLPNNRHLIKKYCSHLRGVIMISATSFAPQILGGADFDGDIVKIIDNSIIRSAVLKGAYKRVMKINENGDKQPIYNYVRSLPIVVIPSVEGNGKNDFRSYKYNHQLTSIDGCNIPITTVIDYDIIKNTFAARIGQISNMALNIGQTQYTPGASNAITLEHPCEECTILTGLEIDACKTGCRPDLSGILLEQGPIKRQFDYIKDFKEPFINNRFRGSQNYTIRYTKNEIESSLDFLVHLFLTKYDAKNVELPGDSANGRYLYFPFMENKAWKKSFTIDDESRKKISSLIKAYGDILSNIRMINHTYVHIQKQTKAGDIFTILNTQYDYKNNPDALVSINDIYNLYETLTLIFTSSDISSSSDVTNPTDKVDEAIERLKNSNWMYLTPENREIELLKILGVNEIIHPCLLLFTNYQSNGYFLLKLFLDEIRSRIANEYRRETTEYILENKQPFDDPSSDFENDYPYYKTYYIQFRNQYLKRIESKLSMSQIKHMFLDSCHNKIAAILNKAEYAIDDKEFFMLLFAETRANRKTSELFWNYFDADTILKYLLSEETPLC